MPIHPNIPQCRHIKVDGQRCGSPAVTGNPFCYFHKGIRKRPQTLRLPPLEDSHSLALGVDRIVQSLVEGRIERSDATALLYAIQVSQNLMKAVSERNQVIAAELLAGEKKRAYDDIKEWFREPSDAEREEAMKTDPAGFEQREEQRQRSRREFLLEMRRIDRM